MTLRATILRAIEIGGGIFIGAMAALAAIGFFQPAMVSM